MSYSSTIFDAASNTIFDEDQKFFKGLSTLSLAHEAMNFDDIIPSSRTRGVYRRRRPRFTNYTRPRFTNHTRRPNAHLLFPPKFRDEDDDASSSCSDTSSVESIGSVESIETAYGAEYIEDKIKDRMTEMRDTIVELRHEAEDITQELQACASRASSSDANVTSDMGDMACKLDAIDSCRKDLTAERRSEHDYRAQVANFREERVALAEALRQLIQDWLAEVDEGLESSLFDEAAAGFRERRKAATIKEKEEQWKASGRDMPERPNYGFGASYLYDSGWREGMPLNFHKKYSHRNVAAQYMKQNWPSLDPWLDDREYNLVANKPYLATRKERQLPPGPKRAYITFWSSEPGGRSWPQTNTLNDVWQIVFPWPEGAHWDGVEEWEPTPVRIAIDYTRNRQQTGSYTPAQRNSALADALPGFDPLPLPEGLDQKEPEFQRLVKKLRSER